MKISITKDEQLKNEIRKKLEENGGYCPCAIVHTEDTKCMCKAFKEQSVSGECHCGLYYKEID